MVIRSLTYPINALRIVTMGLPVFYKNERVRHTFDGH
nr:MAG TPA: hypothetical protein [Caudoviricetes sp.]